MYGAVQGVPFAVEGAQVHVPRANTFSTSPVAGDDSLEGRLGLHTSLPLAYTVVNDGRQLSRFWNRASA
jgi:hypothetical protein